jgi:hypothetical protein
MKLPSFLLASVCLLGTDLVRGADATAPVDYTQRNQPFAPAATITPGKKELPRADPVQDKRVEKAVVGKQPSPVGERRAPVAVEERQAKTVREKDSKRPETVEQPMSAFNHRDAASVTGAEARKPTTVAKYQDGLTAASAANMARFPAMDRATTAKINRFVFLKNSAEPNRVTAGAAVTPAGGANPIRK